MRYAVGTLLNIPGNAIVRVTGIVGADYFVRPLAPALGSPPLTREEREPYVISEIDLDRLGARPHLS
jgi:hypothetical protein